MAKSEHEVIAASLAAAMGAIQVLALTLQKSNALKQGEYAEALREYMEATKETADPMAISILQSLRQAVLS